MVVKKKLKVNWTAKAVQSLENHYHRIKEGSPQSADKVRREILKAVKALPTHPKQYQIDEYYPMESGEIRRFFKWRYRIVYEIHEDTIDVLNIIHTSQEPSTE